MTVLSHLVRMLVPSRLVESEEGDRGQACEDPLNVQPNPVLVRTEPSVKMTFTQLKTKTRCETKTRTKTMATMK